MAFQNSVVGGVTLARPAIQSPDYDPGVSGWAVKIDGSAEFNNVVIRGGTSVGGDTLMYQGTPGPTTLTMSISATGGTDEYGNVYPDGITVFDPESNEVRAQTRLDTDELFGGGFWTRAAEGFPGRSPIYFFLSGRGLSANLTENPVYQDGHVIWYQEEPGIDDFVELNLSSGMPTSNRNAAILALRSSSANRPTPVAEIKAGGGSPSNLYVTGALTAGNMRWGTAQTPAPGGTPGQTFVTITFNTPMPATPVVTVTANSASTNLDNTNIRWSVANKSATGFTINCWRDTNAATNFEWFAVCN